MPPQVIAMRLTATADPLGGALAEHFEAYGPVRDETTLRQVVRAALRSALGAERQTAGLPRVDHRDPLEATLDLSGDAAARASSARVVRAYFEGLVGAADHQRDVSAEELVDAFVVLWRGLRAAG